MAIQEITKDFDNSGSRNDVRNRVVTCFMLETPGQGTGNLASKYNYKVKTLPDGHEIILTRPANLKNGFDFLIRVDGIDFSKGNGRRRDYPKHSDIIEDLEIKKRENLEAYGVLYDLIKDMHACKNVSDKEIEAIQFESGYSSAMIVHVIKWFFIEQDVRYWNYSGRNMFMLAVPTPV